MPPFLQVTAMFLAQDEPSGDSLLETIQKGGSIGYVLIGLSVVALVFTIMHIVQIRRQALVPPDQLDEIDRLLTRGDVAGALAYCADPANDSYLTRILLAGLTRYQKSAFGAFEVKSAVEEAGEEQTSRLYRSTDVLGVIGSIAPLLGLTGTVLGIVGAFDTLSAGAAPDHQTLAGNISLALVTTLLGLLVAMPCMALFTYFRNRIDALASQTGGEIERLLLHLESMSGPRAGAETRRAPGAASPPLPAPAAMPQPAPRVAAAPRGGA